MFLANADLFPNIIQRKLDSDKPFALVVSSKGDLEEFSFEDLDNASDRAAWFLDQYLPPDEGKFFYMGRGDLRYMVWVIAAMKTGKCVVLPSPGNTIPGNQRFFATVGAKTLFYAPETAEMLRPLIQATRETVKTVRTMNYEEILSRDPVESYPFQVDAEEIMDEAVACFHTSGTSGHPKPIYWTHAALKAALQSYYDPEIVSEGDRHAVEEVFRNQKIFVPFPTFHLGGLGPLLMGVVGDHTTILAAPGERLTPPNMVAMMKRSGATAVYAPPALLDNMAQDSEALEVLAKMEHVSYGGGPMNPAHGEKLAKRLPHLCSLFAMSETAFCHMLSSGDSSRWDAVRFIDLGQRMEEVAPGICELVFPRTETIMRRYGFFHAYPDLTEYRTKDLFIPVEGHEGWWTYKGRADGWVAMSNGLKMDPVDMENAITLHPDVSAALVAGSYRFRLCLLVELKEGIKLDSDDDRDAMTEKLWSTIDEANKAVPKFGRIPKELILFTRPEKPILRTPKGTIQRQLTLTLYDAEIDKLYEETEQGLLTRGLPSLKSISPEDLAPFLRDVYAQTLDRDDLADDDDLFASGLDSLVSFVIASRLKAALRNSGVSEEGLQRVDVSLMFSASTIAELARKVSARLSGTVVQNGAQSDMESLLCQYEQELKAVVDEASADTNGPSVARGRTVILTGSTGSLGTYILSSLLANKDVEKVICLSRSSDANKRQIKALKSKGLPPLPAEAEHRILFFQADLAAPQFGLDEKSYSMLWHESTTIIHNAWPVNFLMPVRSFEPQIQGTLNLLHLAQNSPRRPSFLFISSISTAITKDASHITESILNSEQASKLIDQGYAQSKYICERLINSYAISSGRRASVLRVGQICGPLQGSGVWNPWEWLPSLVISSKFMGAAPESLGRMDSIDWIPVDELGRTVSELSLLDGASTDEGGAIVYNVVNPSATSWCKLLPALKKVAAESVSLDEWIERLERSKEMGGHLVQRNPGIKLVDFYKDMLIGNGNVDYDTDNMRAASECANELKSIRQEDLEKWMQAWI